GRGPGAGGPRPPGAPAGPGPGGPGGGGRVPADRPALLGGGPPGGVGAPRSGPARRHSRELRRIPDAAPSGSPRFPERAQGCMSDAPTPPHNFIRQRIADDLAVGIPARSWAGRPGPAADHRGAPPDPARSRTRFPPEPNGYMHIGHAKAICMNFGVAEEFGGRCHLRFDDTNPEKESQEYVDSIIEMVHWLGYSWEAEGESNLYFASDYFEWLYQFAEYLVEDRKSTRLNSSHVKISYAVFCLKKNSSRTTTRTTSGSGSRLKVMTRTMPTAPPA